MVRCKSKGCTNPVFIKKAGLCHSHYFKQWRTDNPEKFNEIRNKYRKNNLDNKSFDALRQYLSYHHNPETRLKSSIKNKRWRIKNREHILTKKKVYYYRHREEILAMKWLEYAYRGLNKR